MGYFRIVDDEWVKLPPEKCPYCKKDFICYEYEQTPGFRFPEEKICPHCGKVLQTSLEYEFYTEIVL